MKILYCNKYNFPFSGTETYLFGAMEMMRSRGHEAALFAMANERGKPTPYDHHFVDHVNFKNADGLRKVPMAFRAAYSIEARRKLRGMIREFRPDVAHVRNIYHHLTPSILWELKAQAVPVLYHMNDFKMLCPSYNMVSAKGEACERCKGGKFWHAVKEGCYPGGRSAAGALAAEAYLHRWLGTYEKCVDLILAPSQFVRQKLIENGWSSQRVTVLPHFQHIPSESKPHPGKGGHVLYFGRLSREKGIGDLLAVAAKIPDLQFVVAGDGPLREELAQVVEREHLDNVKLVGHVTGNALKELVAQSQFTVFPSRAYETLGKSILESYAEARAVIASDLGSRRELVVEGETGLLYRVGDTGQLAAAISFLRDRPELAEKMGRAGRLFTKEKHQESDHFLALTQIYERLSSGRTLAGRGRPPKVAYIGGRGVIGKYSGVESFYEEAGKRLAADGYDITAYCRNYFTPEQSSYSGIEIKRLATIRTKHLDTLVHSLLSTLHACVSDYDIIHYHTLGPSLLSWMPRLFGKKTIVTVQGLDWQRKKWSWFARQVLKAGERASIYLPNKTVVVSRALQQYYQARYRRPVFYVPNGTEARQRRTGRFLRHFRLQSDNYALFLGRFSPEKNCDLLIAAFEAVKTPMKLVLAGGSSHSDAYVDLLRQRASERIVFLDWLSGAVLEEVLTNAALFVLPSDMEGLSLALLDAMGAGVCVLASDVPENCEAVADAGFTFRRGDKAHLREMLMLLLSNPEMRDQAGIRARRRVQEHYLWNRVTERLESIYTDLVDSRAPVDSRLKTAGKAA